MNLREMIDMAKEQAAALDAQAPPVPQMDGSERAIKRKKTSASVEREPIDESNIALASDGELAATLIAQLTELRAQQRLLADRDAAIKSVLQELVGELEYLRVVEGDAPVVSMKHESSVRLVTARVREQFPPEEYPDLYTQVVSRPLRLLS